METRLESASSQQSPFDSTAPAAREGASALPMVPGAPPPTGYFGRAYAWTRFWAPLGLATATFDGFLTDPEDELGAKLNPDARAWAAIAECACLGFVPNAVEFRWR
jgi:hypothetical protein